MTHLLILRFSSMGDVAMIIPSVRCLVKAYPDLKITIVTNRFYKPFFLEFKNINFFATDFHIDLFTDTMMDNYDIDVNKAIRVGWPMEYLANSLDSYKGMPKRNLILFPHRIAPEKQPDIFYDLKDSMSQYEFVVCQDKQLTKNEYHNLLGEAKIVFSANLQETLGISWYEGALVNTIPMVPDRLSYSERENKSLYLPIN